MGNTSDASGGDASQCNADAITYCEANGCPLSGPFAGRMTWNTWCTSIGPFASQVDALGSCALATTPNGPEVATEVALLPSDETELLYDVTSQVLVEVRIWETSSREWRVYGSCFPALACGGGTSGMACP